MSKYTENGSWLLWDHKSPLWSRSLDKYFNTVDEIYEYFDDPWEIDEEVKEDFDSIRESYPQLCNYLELYICNPVYFPELELPQFLYDELPEEWDDIYTAIPQDHPILKKLNNLNSFINKQKYILWYQQSNIKPIPESLADNYKPVINVQPRRRKQHAVL